MRSRSLLLAITLFGGSALPSDLSPPAAAHAADTEAVLLVLQQRSCPGCKLQDADLVHADLRDADLSGAQLQRANLGQARLDGADLRGADLSFTSLRSASLRGANLEGARLYGTDLRGSDLSGVRLDQNALEEAHWQGAQGIAGGVQSHASLHNAGVEAAQAGRWQNAEDLFGEAIKQEPTQSLSWIARGIARAQLVKDDLAAADFRYAASLLQQNGNQAWAEQLQAAANNVSQRRHHQDTPPASNGIGSGFLSGMLGTMRMLAPLAIKAFAPMGMGF
ncbi:pentapeptide repeats family protein [Synechococcus sp. RS9909]|uniref:pentapeptide repeat-containing protein n=1 Tax=unclassified Synechococcus TaxID=2626047 RepID=UPI0000690718|nr:MULTISPECIES: pentapeptide repeat-containing protein [unclassified Synechococcus]EAQ70495.1 hypothetical protein RS9917_06650 [Synechococcus sp. RS9917]QNI80632.1 pentapeptide repeats family protein [Synechococcus sp. RS9909]